MFEKMKKYFKMDTKPTVSIIILSKDSYELIYNCVESIFEKVRFPEYKLVIGDT